MTNEEQFRPGSRTASDARRGPLQGYVLQWRTIIHPVA